MNVSVNLAVTLPPYPRPQYRPSPGLLTWSREPLRPCRPVHHVDGLIMNAYPRRLDSAGALDIRIARDRGYIIADARGIGFDTTTPGQRDSKARLVRDKDKKIGESDKQ